MKFCHLQHLVILIYEQFNSTTCQWGEVCFGKNHCLLTQICLHCIQRATTASILQIKKNSVWDVGRESKQAAFDYRKYSICPFTTKSGRNLFQLKLSYGLCLVGVWTISSSINSSTQKKMYPYNGTKKHSIVIWDGTDVRDNGSKFEPCNRAAERGKWNREWESRLYSRFFNLPFAQSFAPQLLSKGS